MSKTLQHLSAGTVDRVARAICLAEFGDEAKHGEARCCQVGGKDGCCLEAVRPVAEAAIAAIPAEPQASSRWCPECGWGGGGVRDEGCMISPCPRMPHGSSDESRAVSLLHEGSLDMSTAERLAWKKRVETYLSASSTMTRPE